MIVISKRDALAVLGDFDESGGASLDLAAWELSVEPRVAADVWEALRAGNLVRYVGEDPVADESKYRLTAAGWAELRDAAARRARTVASVERDAPVIDERLCEPLAYRLTSLEWVPEGREGISASADEGLTDGRRRE